MKSTSISSACAPNRVPPQPRSPRNLVTSYSEPIGFENRDWPSLSSGA